MYEQALQNPAALSVGEDNFVLFVRQCLDAVNIKYGSLLLSVKYSDVLF